MFDAGFEKWLEGRLTRERYTHSLAVRERAVFLARLHGGNEEKAAIAGLLHDCCHCLAPDAQLKIIKSRGILLDDFTIAHPAIWHAITGSIIISDELGVTDGEIIPAVRYHTTGRSGMTKLEQIVYLADVTSGDRVYPNVDEYRALSEKSLEECMLKNLGYTIEMLAQNGLPIVRDTWEAYNGFWKLKEQ